MRCWVMISELDSCSAKQGMAVTAVEPMLLKVRLIDQPFIPVEMSQLPSQGGYQ
jgi:hypothetical protein